MGRGARTPELLPSVPSAPLSPDPLRARLRALAARWAELGRLSGDDARALGYSYSTPHIFAATAAGLLESASAASEAEAPERAVAQLPMWRSLLKAQRPPTGRRLLETLISELEEGTA